MNQENMEIVDHLDELRKRIIIILATFIAAFITAFIFVQDIYDWLTKDLEMPLAVLGPLDIILIYFSIAAVVSLALAVPVIVLQIWLFVKPGLTPEEQKASLMYIPASFVLFAGGLAFGYFIVIPIVLDFLLNLGAGTFETMFTADRYFQFVLRMTVPFSILFEMPLVVMFLTSIGVITPHGMHKNRKYAYFAIVIVSVLVSPPDFLSDVLVIVPLIFLYEASISLSRIVYKKRMRRLRESSD
ncbi:twin-arginine translocase subunit TatC [Alkalicoccus saliphilus]|jgi:sec-independent protein translocase protein TatC|uniref:Sec-independent protein translocase protein TatC n=1 Tax=Alkalicoccus saliphilus TaxID=200989 RepID=A0A2T4UA59_9BACI|nr:twin-arginine translocase subunit TatC [Alkalicoccus saliphilus]PTL40288.1 twin-arginine translocase subunit TatC [Alkalicoccus saliphilus]